MNASAATPNYRLVLDAASSFCLHFGAYCCRATEPRS